MNKVQTFHVSGDILKANTQVVINTINCVGKMKRGLANDFRLAYPEMNEAYIAACNDGSIRPGKGFLWRLGPEVPGPIRAIYNFVTKDDWRNDSEYEYISSGLVDLKNVLLNGGYLSVAAPPLGCGLGNLDWKIVHGMIVAAFADYEAELKLVIYGPRP